ncbi:unnamed protein product [Brassicogethes aeneus]|uniref:Jouberin n=1 Tax=Brassicogethes aeneus TaxID=1431903 RepID=A0A9P0APM9_BRAAE|nr:unnamed protein product [Brassicogethes aeneus]
MDSNSDSYSLSVPQSLRSETKDKFNALLKNALKKEKKKIKSDEVEMYEQYSTTASSENLLDDRREIVKDDFILNKFLNEPNNDFNFVKPPVPKPRKKKTIRENSVSSQGTFNVSSPKVLKTVQHKSESPDLPSNQTYVKETRQVEKEIGDVILHESPSKISIVSNKSPINVGKISKVSPNHTDNSISDEVKEPSEIMDNLEKTQITAVVDKEILKTTSVDYKYITEIVVHKTDKLLIKSFLIHPVVKIHIVNIKTGKYYSKSNKSRSVIFYYENQETDYIQPILTHAYDLQEKRTLYPSWEEIITINEDFEYLANSDVIYFFEILDFLEISDKQNPIFRKASFKGWHRICFAFLRPIGKNNANNLNKQLRLQLYHINNIKESTEGCYLWKLWNIKKLKKYPSTIYITIKQLIAPDRIIKAIRSKTPLQEEITSEKMLNNDKKNYENENNVAGGEKIMSAFLKPMLKLSKGFQIPNECVAKLEAFSEGCFIHKFSNNGLYLACAVKLNEMFTIIIYSVDTHEEVKKYACHQGLIYSVKWSNKDSFIVTCSADNTVAVWDFNNNTFLQILPHPSFVYAIDVSNRNIVTGCFDGCIRIWSFDEKIRKYNLSQELIKHQNFVTSLCYNKEYLNLYSSDSSGLILIWERKDDWEFKMYLKVLDLQGVIINQILLFPRETKILVNSRDSTLRIVCLKSQVVLHWLQGCLNERVQIFASISSCGDFVMSGSENGLVSIWDSKSGNCLKTYRPFEENSTRPIHCVQFHPLKNLISFSSQILNSPILIYELKNSEADQLNKLVNINEIKKPKIKPRNLKNETCEEKFDFHKILQSIDEMLH